MLDVGNRWKEFIFKEKFWRHNADAEAQCRCIGVDDTYVYGEKLAF